MIYITARALKILALTQPGPALGDHAFTQIFMDYVGS